MLVKPVRNGAIQSDLRNPLKTSSLALDRIKYINAARDMHFPPDSTAGNPAAVLELKLGNQVLVYTGSYKTSALTHSVSDNLGNTYTLLAPTSNLSNVRLHLYLATVTVAGTATITYTHDGAFSSCYAVQVSGVNTADPVDSWLAVPGTTYGVLGTVKSNPVALTTTTKDTLILYLGHKDGTVTSTPYTWSPAMRLPMGNGVGVPSQQDRVMGMRTERSIVTAREYQITVTQGYWYGAMAVALKAV